MREIKFRGKDIKTNEWRYGYYKKDSNTIPNILRAAGLAVTNELHFIDGFLIYGETIGQFTGKKDVDSVDIYEGSTIEWFNAQGIDDGLATVFWDKDRSEFDIENDDDNILEPLYNVVGSCRVIG